MLIVADARHLPLVDSCVDCVVTSPPYFGLRDYNGHRAQIGLEQTPSEFVTALVDVFRDVRRVLKGTGTVWLNLGDSYNNSDKWGGGGPNTGKHVTNKRNGQVPSWSVRRKWAGMEGTKPKDMLMIPARVALALQADGWYLRQDIIWHKPNPMPESVLDRCTKAHEYVFLLSKSERYHFDAAAIATPGSLQKSGNTQHKYVTDDPKHRTKAGFLEMRDKVYERVNRRSVWTIPTQPFSGAHFATFPEALVEPCILAGCPLGGVVLDPFVGSGTVGAVAERLGRRWVGTDLGYQDISRERTAQRGIAFA